MLKGASVFTRRFVFAVAFILITASAPIHAATPPGNSTPTPEFTPPPFRSQHFQDIPQLPGVEAPTSSNQAPEAAALYPWARLTFQSYRDNNWEIYIGNDNGSGQTRLTYDGATDMQPRLNRGATRLVFASKRTGNYDIFAMNPDGSGLVQLTFDGKDDAGPYWSPDGSRIVFQAYRDGQAEIYVMKADGSGQTRLTANVGYDGEPAWSPDGAQIAFVSNHTGGPSDYFLWVMNADGSNQHQLVALPYMGDPVWSPDGSKIAFDAAGADGWQNLWVVNADGSSPHAVFDEGGYAEAWAGSWSPDGGYLAFTRIYYTVYNNQLYWTYAYLDAWNSGTGSVTRLSSSGEDWRPDWQSTDIVAPTSSMMPLPAESPSPIIVRWSAFDTGASGVQYYDVQVKDGTNGVWTAWNNFPPTATSASYSGVGGHAYYFRVRAHDNATNVEAWPTDYAAMTTVEALPPNTTVQALPAYVKNSTLVQWGGSDLGNSGIQVYDVQYQDVTAGGGWVDWQIGITATSAIFNGLLGHHYTFRSRAIDRAQNMEGWPASEDTQTTFYAWAITGHVYDNTGVPVSSAIITTTPTAAEVFTSNAAGLYAAYVLTNTYTYTTSWSKEGYGIVPETSFDSGWEPPFCPTTNGQLDVFLPPVDNVIQNGDFESEFGEGNWWVTGFAALAITNTGRHSGNTMVALGVSKSFVLPVNVSNSGGNSLPAMATEANNIVHMVWQNKMLDKLFYAQRNANGLWSIPQVIPGTPSSSSHPQIAIDQNNVIHAVWFVGDYLYGAVYYAYRTPDGVWSLPQKISNAVGNSRFPRMVVDKNNIVHVIWYWVDSSFDIVYTRRDNNGNWSTPVNTSQFPQNKSSAQLIVDNAGNAHIIWVDLNSVDGISGTSNIYSASSYGYGAWSNPEMISQSDVVHAMSAVADGNGAVHIVWASNSGIHYLQHASNNSWLPPQSISTLVVIMGDYLKPVIDSHGILHVLFDENGILGQHIYRNNNGVWSNPQTLPGYPERIASDNNGNLHMVWRKDFVIHYARWNELSGWSNSQDVSLLDAGLAQDPSLAIDTNGVAHIAWFSDQQGIHDVYYTTFALANQADTSSITQTVNIPITAPTPTLSFFYQLNGGDIAPLNSFEVQVDNGITDTMLFSAINDTRTWTHQWIDVGPWAGQLITVTFSTHQLAGTPSISVLLDDISLGSAHPDVWTQIEGPLTAPLGSPAIFRLIYGNQGGALASGVFLTATIPSEFNFVDATLTPISTTQPLVWNMGDLPAKSGPYTITITATVSPTATAFINLTSQTNIATSSDELETANNVAQTRTFIGNRVYLPLIAR